MPHSPWKLLLGNGHGRSVSRQPCPNTPSQHTSYPSNLPESSFSLSPPRMLAVLLSPIYFHRQPIIMHPLHMTKLPQGIFHNQLCTATSYDFHSQGDTGEGQIKYTLSSLSRNSTIQVFTLYMLSQ